MSRRDPSVLQPRTARCVWARSTDPEASIADLIAELSLIPWDIAAVMPGKNDVAWLVLKDNPPLF